MNYCNQCGEELVEGAKFCKHCGTPVVEKEQSPELEQPVEQASNVEGQETVEPVEAEETTVKEEQVTAAQEEPVNPEPGTQEKGGLAAASKKSGQGFKLSKPAILSISIVGALILILFVGFFVASSMASPNKIVEKFEEAMHEKDTDTVADLLSSKSLSLEIDKKSVEGFVEYFNENPSEMDLLIDHLKDQVKQYKENPDFKVDDWYAVNLEKDGKFLVFDNYDITVSPVYFNVYTNYNETEIYLGDEVVATADSDEYYKEIGPFLPGLYSFKAVYKSEYVELTSEVESTNFDPGYTQEVDLYLDGTDVLFELPYYENLENVKLYLNGEDIGVNLVEDNEVGPLLTDGSMTFAYEAEFPFGTVKSEELPIDSGYMYADFKAGDELKQSLQDVIVQFNKEYLAALTTADGSQLTVANETVIDDVVSGAEDDREWGYNYTGKFIGIDFYDNSFEFFNYGDAWTVDVATNTLTEEAIFYDDEEAPALEPTENEITYELTYDEASSAWLVSYVSWGAYYDSDSVTEYREENPETYTSKWANSQKE
ncbi:zinc ribbon domain-containing protein [Ornithinibacillus xuwenensis]|uniref:Zinc-ribbon domain-containing protein n=1 Tax=Ornithinibacillus xuwenensis TaxID=3144668 RepID=A0ABU9XPA0_9BACI